MRLPIQKDLYPGDLFVARKALESFQKDREELLRHISNKNYMIFEISFWDKAKWRENRDVPDGRMYYFGIANEQDPQECLDAIIAWLKSEIDRVELILVESYKDQHEFSKSTIDSAETSRQKRHRIPIWYGVVLWLSLAMFIPGFYMMISKSSFLGGLALVVGSVVPLYIFLTRIKRHQISSIV